MSTVTLDFNTDDFISAYRLGSPKKELAKRFGISCHRINETIYFLKLERPESSKGITPEICFERFTSGESKSSIAHSFGVNLSIVQNMLAYCGIPRAGSQKEGIKLRYSFMSDEARKEITKKANQGRKGNIDTYERKIRRAKTNSQNFTNVSKYERTFAELLTENGIEFTQQANIGIYNADFAVGNIAVEIFGGGWHAYGEHLARLAKRTNYILNNGFNLFIIWVGIGNDKVITINALNDLIKWRQELSLNPSTFGKYRVIRGNGEFVSVGSSNDDYFALIPPCIRSNYPIANNFSIRD